MQKNISMTGNCDIIIITQIVSLVKGTAVCLGNRKRSGLPVDNRWQPTVVFFRIEAKVALTHVTLSDSEESR